MINFKVIRYRNFLSAGNKFIEQSFTPGQKKLIIGKNGAGKSIIIDALCFVLYNKAFRKCKKDQLVNSINQKNLIVELEFEIAGKEYKLRRGVRPVFTELYINGKLKDQDASSYDYQAYIENSVLRMTEKTFRQIVVLGSTAFVPFMRLPALHRRTVIEDLLEVAIFSNMYDVIKKKSHAMQTQYENLLNEIKLINNSITHKTSELNNLDKSNDDIIEQNNIKLINLLAGYDQLDIELKKLTSDTVNHTNDMQNINQELGKYEEDKFELMDLVSKISLNKTKNEKEIKFFKENEHCHVCHQDIKTSFKNTKISQNKKKIKEFAEGLTQIEELIENKSQLIISSNTTISKLKNDLLTVNNTVNAITTNVELRESLLELNDKLKNSNHNELVLIEKNIASYKKKLAKANKKKAEFTKTVNSFTYISKLLKDDGIKSKIIKTYLPVINKLIRKYLDLMDFSIDFRFDEFFNETIKARYKDNFSYGNFSEGQKLRIDLCLLFTWRELSRLKNSAATHLIILDEVGDSSLDIEGFDAFIKILNVDKDKQCAIIISHKPEGIATAVDEIITASMVGNFTEMQSNFPETN